MTKANKSTLGNSLIQEIIRLFFNERSYFYHTFNKLLQAESQKKDVDSATLELIQRFFKLLIQADNANSIYQEVSQLKGLEDLYPALNSQLSQLSLGELSKADTKKIISDVAANTFAFWKQKFSQPDLQRYFKTYLNLKEDLLNFLNSPGEGDTFLELENAGNLIKSESPFSFTKPPQKEENAEESKTENVPGFRNFLKSEMESIFEKWKFESLEEKKGDEAQNFLKSSKEVFEVVFELAKFHDVSKIIRICQETLGYIERLSLAERELSRKDIELLVKAKELIFKSIDEPESNGLHHFLQSIKDTSSGPQTEKFGGEEEKKSFANEQKVEYNPLYASNGTGRGTDSLAEEDEADSEDGDLKDGEKIHFQLPGEDNEELLNLIKDVSLSVNFTKDSNGEEARDPDEIGPAAELDYESLKEVTDREAYQAFAHQAKPMAKIIFDSLKLLNEDYGANKHVIEDIELASASLKHLAKKLNLQKLAFLPELVESICINVNVADLKIPTGFLASIARGIKHLISYDPTDDLHESVLIDILSELKRYYAHTVRIIEQTQMASS